MLLGRRVVAGLHLHRGREQNVVQLDRLIERALIRVTAHFVQLAPYRLELLAQRLDRVGDAFGVRLVLCLRDTLIELCLDVLDSNGRVHDICDPVADLDREIVLAFQLRGGALHPWIGDDGELPRESVSAEDQPHGVVRRRRDGTVERAFVEERVPHFLRAGIAQVPHEAIGSRARGHDRVRGFVHETVAHRLARALRDRVRRGSQRVGRRRIAGERADHVPRRVAELQRDLRCWRRSQVVVDGRAAARVLSRGETFAAAAHPADRGGRLKQIRLPPADGIQLPQQ